MARVCEVCTKSTVAGRNTQHHSSIQWRYRAPRTVRVFKPNLRTAQVITENKEKKATVCMKCYKKMRQGNTVNTYSLPVKEIGKETPAEAAA